MSSRTPGPTELFPFGQPRQQYHHYWGQYTDTSELPNNTGGVNGIDLANFYLEAGDLAYVMTDLAGPPAGLYLCTSQGTAGGQDATWELLATASSIVDRFAPKHLVGNTAAGDSAIAYSTAGFSYYPDTGNGLQLQAALVAAAAGDGDVWIRPGTYDYNNGTINGPLTIGANVRVLGAGTGATIIVGRNTNPTPLAPVDQGVFILDGGSLRDITLRVFVNVGTTTAGSVAALAVASGGGDVENVSISYATDSVVGTLRNGLRVTDGGTTLKNVSVTTTDGATAADGYSVVFAGAANVRSESLSTSGVVANSVRLLGSAQWVASAGVHSGWTVDSIHVETGSTASINLDQVFVSQVLAVGTGSALNLLGGQAGTPHQVNACKIFGSLNPAAATSLVVTTTHSLILTDSRINGGRTSIAITGASDCIIANNDITNGQLVGPGPAVIIESGSNNRLENNRIRSPGGSTRAVSSTGTGFSFLNNTVTGFGGSVRAVLLDGNDVRCIGNEMVGTTGSGCIEVSSTSFVVSNNRLRQDLLNLGTESLILISDPTSQQPSVCSGNVMSVLGANAKPGILNNSDLISIMGNTIVLVTANAGIVLPAGADNNVAVGNIVSGVGANPAVSDAGTGNELAHNIGV